MLMTLYLETENVTNHSTHDTILVLFLESFAAKANDLRILKERILQHKYNWVRI